MEAPGGASNIVLGEAEAEARFLMDRPTRLIPIPTMSASRILLGGTFILAGLILDEAAGAAAVWDLLDGLDANGQLAFPINFAANGTTQLQMGRDGPLIRTGLFANRTSGSIRGALWVKL